MDDLTGLYALNRIRQRREQRSVMLHPVPLNVDNHDSEGDLLEIVLVFETSICGDHHIALASRLGDQHGVREGTPTRFGNGQDLMIRKRLPQTRIDALF